MATVVVEQVVSEYTLDPSKYVAGSKAVIGAAKTTSDVLGGLSKTIHAGLAGARNIGIGVAALSVPVALLGKNAIDSALAYDTMNRTLKAVTGSAQRAKEVLGFVDKLAIPSIFTTAQLGEAAKTLEAFGLKTERFLPIAEKLGTVFGGSATDLNQFVNSLGMLKGGRFGEAFESLARAGISRDALKVRGLQFDKGGEFKGDVKQALDAVEAEVNARFGTLAKEMADGPAAKMASVMDALGRASRAVGLRILETFVPAIERLGDAIQNLVDKGYVDKIAKGFMSLFNTKALGDSFVTTLVYMVAILERTPKTVTNLWKTFKDAFTNIRTVLIETLAVLGGMFLAGPIVTGVVNLIKLFGILRKSIQAAGIASVIMEAVATGGASFAANAAGLAAGLATAAGIAVALDQLLPEIKDISGGATVADLTKRVGEIMKDLKSGSAPTTTSASTSKPGDTGTPSRTTGILEDIKKASEHTAENTKKMSDIQDRVLGGGTLGSRGLSKEELGKAGASGSKHPAVHVALMNLGKAIDQVMAGQTARAFGQQTTRREI